MIELILAKLAASILLALYVTCLYQAPSARKTVKEVYELLASFLVRKWKRGGA